MDKDFDSKKMTNDTSKDKVSFLDYIIYWTIILGKKLFDLLKKLINFLLNYYNSSVDEILNYEEKYDKYSDDRLIRMFKDTDGYKGKQRIAISRLLKERDLI